MHFLSRLIHGKTAVAEELAKNEKALHDDLEKFFESYNIKEDVMDRLISGEPIQMHLHKLQYALQEELRTVEETEKTEHEILSDLKYMSREHYIRRLDEVCGELRHAKGRDPYVRHILSELHDTIMSEARKVRRMLKGDHNYEVREALIDLFTIERHLVEKLSMIEDFQQLFRDLFTGELRRQAIDRSRSRLKSLVRDRMKKLAVDASGRVTPTDDHYLTELTARICNKLNAAISDAIKGGYINRHPKVDVDFVNSGLFDRFVAEELHHDQAQGKFIPSNGTMHAFVSVFREMYGEV